MKKIILIALFAFSFNIINAQVVPVLTTTLTPGSGDFLVDKSHYPFDAFVLYILSSDTSKVGLNYTLTGGMFLNTKARVKYIDGRTGHPFVSITRLKQFYDSFMVSPPFTTTISGDLNILGDATAANQTTMIARLDSIAKWQTNEGITKYVLAIADTLAIPAGSIMIGGIVTATGAKMAVTDVTGETTAEQFIIAAQGQGLPPQSYKALSTAHTITMVTACNVFILKLH